MNWGFERPSGTPVSVVNRKKMPFGRAFCFLSSHLRVAFFVLFFRLASASFCIHNKSMEFTFDPLKDPITSKRMASRIADGVRLDWSGMLVRPDTRRDYGEERYLGIAPLGDRLYSVVFTALSSHRATRRCASSVCGRPATRKLTRMSKARLTRNTPEEEAAIQRGIADDPDNPEWTAEDMANARPFPDLVTQKRMGRPPKENPKEQVSVRYDADILAAFRATGEGWQTRMNDALRTYLAEHPIEEAHGQ